MTEQAGAPAAADAAFTPRARARILDAALAMMSERGASGMSMRQLAAACELNVATLYHYFPSKADLLRSVIEERRYDERLMTEAPNLDPSLEPRERLVELLVWLWSNTLQEEAVLRLLLGEGLRGDPEARASTTVLLEVLDGAIDTWLRDGFPEAAMAGLAPVLRSQVLAFVIEHLALAPLSVAEARSRSERLAAIALP